MRPLSPLRPNIGQGVPSRAITAPPATKPLARPARPAAEKRATRPKCRPERTRMATTSAPSRSRPITANRSCSAASPLTWAIRFSGSSLKPPAIAGRTSAARKATSASPASSTGEEVQNPLPERCSDPWVRERPPGDGTREASWALTVTGAVLDSWLLGRPDRRLFADGSRVVRDFRCAVAAPGIIGALPCDGRAGQPAGRRRGGPEGGRNGRASPVRRTRSGDPQLGRQPVRAVTG